MIKTSIPCNTVYPERDNEEENFIERVAYNIFGRAHKKISNKLNNFDLIIDAVSSNKVSVALFDDDELKQESRKTGELIRLKGFEIELVARIFALVREAAWRTLGLKHFDVQLVGGYALLFNVIAEMETGEGKTLTATLTASTAALSGMPVHIITANDYLALRDAEEMKPVYNVLGLSVGVIQQNMNPQERRQAYASNITYCSNKEIAFDYLKDRIVLGQERSSARLLVENLYHESPRINQLMLRGLHFAIVDEADSVLIDEARTPLIISREIDDSGETEMYQQALDIAEQLKYKEDYTFNEQERIIRFTSDGEDALRKLADNMGGIWFGVNRSSELIKIALTAKFLYIRDRDYLVKDNKVQIIDEYTGRLMPDRRWEGGLHQCIEMKEGCELTGNNETLARMSFQRLFKRYIHLSGMTGTAREAASEFWSVYKLDIIYVPTHRPVKREMLQTKIFSKSDEKWRYIIEAIKKISSDNRPVLVGTRSVKDSEYLSGLLKENGLEHEVLNALQDNTEAEIIRMAGQAKQVTIATNMAGRGTDIRLSEDVEKKGGLHVICTENHDAGRIDRQLIGRCGRQGDRGSYQSVLSLDDEIVIKYMHDAVRAWCKKSMSKRQRFKSRFTERLMHSAQKAAERDNAKIRSELLKLDGKMDEILSFTGRAE